MLPACRASAYGSYSGSWTNSSTALLEGNCMIAISVQSFSGPSRTVILPLRDKYRPPFLSTILWPLAPYSATQAGLANLISAIKNTLITLLHTTVCTARKIGNASAAHVSWPASGHAPTRSSHENQSDTTDSAVDA